jgi:hypothetical protein
MKVSNAIAQLKENTHDIAGTFSTDRCVEFLNTAIQQVSSMLISAKWPSLVKELTVKDGDELPHNYMQSAGTYPLRMTGGKVTIVDSAFPSIRFRYFATPDLITATTDSMPIDHDGVNDVIVRSATILALNDNEYDISQDGSILSSLQQAIASGMGG